MSAPYHFPEEKFEDGLESVLSAHSDADAPIIVGQSDDTCVVPCVTVVVVSSESETRERTLTGNHRLVCEVSVRTHYRDTSRADHKALVGQVRDTLHDSDLIGWLNAAGQDMSVYHCLPVRFARSVEGSHRVSTQTVEVYLAPSS